MIKELVLKTRSYRRFYEDVPVEYETLKALVDLARNSASAANLQPLKYVLSCDRDKNSLIFPHLAWAAYLKDWPGPDEGERPSAYIIILKDKGISKAIDCDHGIAAQSIMLGATDKGLGGCMIGAVRRKRLHKALELLVNHEILLVLAIGKPKEMVEIEPLGADQNIRYWRDSNDVHHVPKRALEDIIVEV